MTVGHRLFAIGGAVIVLAIVLVCAVYIPAVHAQEAPQQSGDIYNGAATDEALGTYVINALDRLLIVVYAGDRQIDEFDKYVKSDGTVYLPYLQNDIKISGLKLLDAEDLLEKKSLEFIRDPRVVITVVGSFTHTVSTYGKIQSSTVELRTPMRVLQLMAKVGGPFEDARTDSIRVISTDGTVRFFDYERLNANPNDEENFFVKPGDIIFVPAENDLTVQVLGAVVSPGTYSFSKGTSLIDALLRAGSWVADSDLKHVRVITTIGGRVVVRKINIKDIFDKGNRTLDIGLTDGDMIFLPYGRTQAFLQTMTLVFGLISTMVSSFVIYKTYNN